MAKFLFPLVLVFSLLLSGCGKDYFDVDRDVFPASFSIYEREPIPYNFILCDDGLVSVNTPDGQMSYSELMAFRVINRSSEPRSFEVVGAFDCSVKKLPIGDVRVLKLHPEVGPITFRSPDMSINNQLTLQIIPEKSVQTGRYKHPWQR